MGEVDASFLQAKLAEAQERLASLEKAGGGGDDGGMDGIGARIGALEGDMKEVKADIKALAKSMAVIEGKLSNMPSTFQMVTWFIGVSFALTGLVFAIARSAVVAH